MNVITQQRQRLLPGQLMRRHPALQRLGDADCRLHDGTQLIDAVVKHPVLHQPCCRANREHDGERRKPEQQGQLGAKLESAEDVHGQ